MLFLAVLLSSESRTQTHKLTHTKVKEAVTGLMHRNLQRAVIRAGLNADSRVQPFKNLAGVKMGNIIGVNIRVYLTLVFACLCLCVR